MFIISIIATPLHLSFKKRGLTIEDLALSKWIYSTGFKSTISFEKKTFSPLTMCVLILSILKNKNKKKL